MTAAAPEVTEDLESLLRLSPPTCNIRYKPGTRELCGKLASWLAIMPCGCTGGCSFACQGCKEITERELENSLTRSWTVECRQCGVKVTNLKWVPL